MIQEPVVELITRQEPAICSLIELHPAAAAHTGPRARMVIAKLGAPTAIAEWLDWPGSEKGVDNFIGQWVRWEACAKCAPQRMLKKQNSGFTALQAAMSKCCSGTSGAWTGWRDHIDNEVHFAMALFADKASRLQHRELNLEDLVPWRTTGACQAILNQRIAGTSRVIQVVFTSLPGIDCAPDVQH